MDYYAIIGMVVLALIAIFGFLISIRKSMNDDRKPIEDLNISVTRLNGNFENMLQRDSIRDKRLDKHEDEIDIIRETQRQNEKTLAKHELRIEALEKQK